MIKDPKVDEFLAAIESWQQELSLLRSYLFDCLLTETLKWRVPCYTFQGKNIIIIGGFKHYCALSFFKGVLLEDEARLLHAPGENSQSGRMFKFTNLNQIIEQEAIIKAYIFEAIEIEKAGLKVESKKDDELNLPIELENKFKENLQFKKAFEALTPGRQRGYNIYFSDAKQAKTRIQRIEQSVQRILHGKGFNDCTCGLSKKMPSCDGSHKTIPGFKRL